MAAARRSAAAEMSVSLAVLVFVGWLMAITFAVAPRLLQGTVSLSDTLGT